MENFKVIFYKFLLLVVIPIFVFITSIHILTFFKVELPQFYEILIGIFSFSIFLIILVSGLFEWIINHNLDRKLVSIGEEIKNAKPFSEKTKTFVKNHTTSVLGKVFIFLYFVLGFYGFINFFLYYGKDTVEIEIGRYVQKHQSRIVKELTKDEFDAEFAKQLRFESGHLLVIYFAIIGGIYFGEITNFEEQKQLKL